MKAKIVIMTAMLLFSVSVVFSQTSWEEVNLPNDITAMAVNEDEVLIFSFGEYYVSSAPLSTTPGWQIKDLPLPEMVKSAYFLQNKLFVLHSGGNLYSLENDNTWKLEQEGIVGISVESYNLFAWSGDKIFQYNNTWFNQVEMSGVIYVAGGSGQIIVATSNQEIYQGKNLADLELLKKTEIRVNKILINQNQYIYIGDVVGDLAAYHLSPLLQSYAYDHILTDGFLDAVVAFQGEIYVAGRFGAKGILFDAENMGISTKFSENVQELCANSRMLLALSAGRLYMSIASSASSGGFFKSTPVPFQVRPNPAVNGLLKIDASEDLAVKVSTLDGRQLAYVNLKVGENLISTKNWSRGTYLISSLKGSLKFIIQ